MTCFLFVLFIVDQWIHILAYKRTENIFQDHDHDNTIYATKFKT